MKDKLAEKIKTAILFIIENPSRDDFVMMNCRIINQEGDDNSIDLSGYWREQRTIVDNLLLDLEKYSISKPITDLDIEAFADTQAIAYSKKDFERGLWLGIKTGAKAAFNGEIKHIEP
jgi:hypothetical protein